jgi:hypothetical protein
LEIGNFEDEYESKEDNCKVDKEVVGGAEGP